MPKDERKAPPRGYEAFQVNFSLDPYSGRISGYEEYTDHDDGSRTYHRKQPSVVSNGTGARDAEW